MLTHSMSEMDANVLLSLGMSSVLQELWNRKDMVVVGLCAVCFKLTVLCSCDGKEDINVVRVRMPASLVKVDIINAMTRSSCFAYTF